MARAAVFLDRDGVINENKADYIRRWSEVRFLPGSLRALGRLARTAFAIVVVSNQSAVGRGLVSMWEVYDINYRLREVVEAVGGRIDAAYICPHRPEERCFCRKPRPGLLLRAAEDLDLDLARSYMVGDALSDVEAALAVGVRPLLVRTGLGQEQEEFLPEEWRQECVVVNDLPEAADWILRDLAQKRASRGIVV